MCIRDSAGCPGRARGDQGDAGPGRRVRCVHGVCGFQRGDLGPGAVAGDAAAPRYAEGDHRRIGDLRCAAPDELFRWSPAAVSRVAVRVRPVSYTHLTLPTIL